MFLPGGIMTHVLVVSGICGRGRGLLTVYNSNSNTTPSLINQDVLMMIFGTDQTGYLIGDHYYVSYG